MRELNPINKAFCLHQLFESNYSKLLRLIPILEDMESSTSCMTRNQCSTLRMQVLERSPYTLIIQLLLSSNDDQTDMANSDFSLKIRIYMDTKAAEVVSPHNKALAELPAMQYPKAALDAKWRVNYLFDKWLDHCLGAGYMMLDKNHRYPVTV